MGYAYNPYAWKSRQEDRKLKVILGYTESLRPSWVTWVPVSKAGGEGLGMKLSVSKPGCLCGDPMLSPKWFNKGIAKNTLLRPDIRAHAVIPISRG